MYTVQRCNRSGVYVHLSAWFVCLFVRSALPLFLFFKMIRMMTTTMVTIMMTVLIITLPPYVASNISIGPCVLNSVLFPERESAYWSCVWSVCCRLRKRGAPTQLQTARDSQLGGLGQHECPPPWMVVRIHASCWVVVVMVWSMVCIDGWDWGGKTEFFPSATLKLQGNEEEREKMV